MNIQVLETTILQAVDILRWVDGASGTSDAVDAKRPIDHVLALQLSAGPSDLVVRHRTGATALWRRGDTTLVKGAADASQLERPAGLSFALSATVFDPRGAYNPRRISLTAGDGAAHTLMLFPSPRAISFGPGGGLMGRLCYAADDRPAAWACLTLTVTIGPTGQLEFWAQADADGQFRLAMSRLPPLPHGKDHYAAKLHVKAVPGAGAKTPPDLSVDTDFHTMAILKPEHHPAAHQFTTALPLQVKPAEVQRLASVDKTSLALRPA